MVWNRAEQVGQRNKVSLVAAELLSCNEPGVWIYVLQTVIIRDSLNRPAIVFVPLCELKQLHKRRYLLMVWSFRGDCSKDLFGVTHHARGSTGHASSE